MVTTTGITLRDAVREYFSVRKLKEQTEADYAKRLHRCFRDWLDLPIVQISDEMVFRRHLELTNIAGPATANLGMRVLRAIINFARVRFRFPRQCDKNPVEYISSLRAWNRLKARKSYIKPHQMPSWFGAVLDLDQHCTRDFLLFVLLTGCRKSEALNLTWLDVDFKDESMVFRNTKNGSDHHLPLSDYLSEMLARRKTLSKSRFVFASGRLPDSPLKDWRRGHQSVTRQSGVSFTLHDLRRTFLTVAESAGIPMHVLKRLANHAEQDVTERYVISSVEGLRKPMQRVTDALLNQAGIEGSSTNKSHVI